MNVLRYPRTPWVHPWRWIRALGVAIAMVPSTAALTKDVYDGKVELTEEGPRDGRSRRA